MIIAAAVLACLGEATAAGDRIILPAIANKATYRAACQALVTAGGKRVPGGYLFPGQDAAAVLTGMRVTADVAAPADTGYYPTPGPVVDLLIGSAAGGQGTLAGMRILEPSAGTGAIAAEAARQGGLVDCWEIVPDHTRHLESQGCYLSVTCGDFLTASPEMDSVTRSRPYDLVLMNPPWRRGLETRHVLHAWDFVRPGGQLAAVLPVNVTWLGDKRTRELRDKLITAAGGTVTELPERAFDSVGLHVRSVILTARRPAG